MTNNNAYKASIEYTLDTLSLLFFSHRRHLLFLLNSAYRMIFCTLLWISNDLMNIKLPLLCLGSHYWTNIIFVCAVLECLYIFSVWIFYPCTLEISAFQVRCILHISSLLFLRKIEGLLQRVHSFSYTRWIDSRSNIEHGNYN